MFAYVPLGQDVEVMQEVPDKKKGLLHFVQVVIVVQYVHGVTHDKQTPVESL